MAVASDPAAARAGATPPVERFPAFATETPESVPLFFYHVPKTGGTSVEGALAALSIQRQQPLRMIPMDVGMGDAVPSVDILSDRSPIAYAGHCRFGFHTRLPIAVRLCTVLRDPVDRVTSQFLWGWKSAKRSDPPTAGHFRRWLVSRAESNGMARMIAGPGADESALLDRAMANLDAFFLVGTTERLGEFVTCLLSAYGGPSVVMARAKFEPSPLKGEIAEGFRALIAERNPIDVALYDHARARHFGRVTAQRAKLKGPVTPPMAVANPSGKAFVVTAST